MKLLDIVATKIYFFELIQSFCNNLIASKCTYQFKQINIIVKVNKPKNVAC